MNSDAVTVWTSVLPRRQNSILLIGVLCFYNQQVRTMARNHGMTEDEVEAAKDEIHNLFEEVREDLAEDLGGEPDDYRAERPATDGGE
jgi:hypothetical protein